MGHVDQQHALRGFEDALWASKARIEWIRDHVHLAAEAGALSKEDALDVGDHTDEADEALLGPLSILSYLGRSARKTTRASFTSCGYSNWTACPP